MTVLKTLRWGRRVCFIRWALHGSAGNTRAGVARRPSRRWAGHPCALSGGGGGACPPLFLGFSGETKPISRKWFVCGWMGWAAEAWAGLKGSGICRTFSKSVRNLSNLPRAGACYFSVRARGFSGGWGWFKDQRDASGDNTLRRIRGVRGRERAESGEQSHFAPRPLQFMMAHGSKRKAWIDAVGGWFAAG